MIETYFYLHSMAKIKLDFFQQQTPELYRYEQKKIKNICGGWVPEMCLYVGKIYKIRSTNSDKSLNLEHCPFVWDPRLGTVLEVDTNNPAGYYYLNEFTDNNDPINNEIPSGYTISTTYSNKTVGSIINMPIKHKKPLLKSIFRKDSV